MFSDPVTEEMTVERGLQFYTHIKSKDVVGKEGMSL
jgi:hypothetical protein